jgi:hypothetical protein
MRGGPSGAALQSAAAPSALLRPSAIMLPALRHCVRSTSLLKRTLAAVVTRAMITFALALLLVQRGALAAPGVMPQHTAAGCIPPAVGVRSSRTMSDDLSAGVRVHHGDRSIDMWLITPLSAHWSERVAQAPSALEQMKARQWKSTPRGGPRARFERIHLGLPAASRLARPRLGHA